MIRWTHCFDSLSPFKELANKTFSEALQRLETKRFRKLATRVWVIKERRHHPLPHSKESLVVKLFEERDDIRRFFVEAIINDSDTTEEDVWHLQGAFINILLTRDFAWALDRIVAAEQSRRPQWATAISVLTRPETACAYWDTLLNRIETLPELNAKFLWLRAWNIDEPDARKAKAQWIRAQRRRERFNRRRNLSNVWKH
jgi:hypothetical protein